MSSRSFKRERTREIRRAQRRARRLAHRSLLAGATIGAAAAFGAPGASAATFTVDNDQDTTAAGACSPSVPMDCSLRQAVAAATAANGADIVSLSDITGTITLTNGEVFGGGSGGITIQGPGPENLTISGDANTDGVHDINDGTGGDSRIFRFGTSSAEISGLTLRGGVAPADTVAPIFPEEGGAIKTFGALTVTDSVLTDNLANGSGGAIDTTAAVTIIDSELSGNSAYAEGGAISMRTAFNPLTITDSALSGNQSYGEDYNRAPTKQADYTSGSGGAVFSFSQSTTISGSTITGNTAADYNIPDTDHWAVTSAGGGVYLGAGNGGSIEISDSEISQNSAVSDGGGLWLSASQTTIEDSAISGNTLVGAPEGSYGAGLTATEETEISGSTISGNAAVGPDASSGGGIDWSAEEGGGLTISNSTISGNEAADAGGGLSLFTVNYDGDFGDYVSGPVEVRNSTIAGNTATRAGGIYEAAYGSPGLKTEGVSLSSSIVADNATGDIDTEGSTPGFIAGNSLIEECAGPFTVTSSPANSNVFGLDPQLGVLQDNSAAPGSAPPLLTHAPEATSPALDAGVANGLTTDEDGTPRTVDVAADQRGGSDGTDIGAVEAASGDGSSELGDAICGTPPPPPPDGGGGTGGNAPATPPSQAKAPAKKSCKGKGGKKPKKCRKGKKPKKKTKK